MISDSPRRRLPRWASTLVVVGVSVLCLTPFPGRSLIEQASSTVLTPVQFGVSGTFGEIGSVIDTVQRVRDLAQQNRAYRDQLDELQSDVVRLQTESRTTGVLRGQSQGNLMVIAYIPQTDDVQQGAVVITSGLGEVFPEGLVVGKVARVERKDADPFQAAVVEPAVEMDKLERLYVLVDTGK